MALPEEHGETKNKNDFRNPDEHQKPKTLNRDRSYSLNVNSLPPQDLKQAPKGCLLTDKPAKKVNLNTPR